MNPTLDQLLIVVLALNFLALGASRLRTVIRAVAVQGALIGLLPLLIHKDFDFAGLLQLENLRSLLLSAGTIILKGVVLPSFLFYAKREADIRHESHPTIGYIPSLLLGAVGISLAVVFARTLPLLDEHKDTLLVPASLATAFCGFLILTTRKMAINQVVGYLVLENGIILFGMLLLEAMPVLVEIGALLDLFTGIFVMGIIIHHINREFASISTEHLTELKD
jgi:hydrogenase-4 component E